MANAYSGTNNSKKLKNTLSELESALADWDKIPVTNDSQANADLATDSQGVQRRSPPGAEVPDEMKQRTKALLDQLKQQIDEL